jgi:hypothetical protein
MQVTAALPITGADMTLPSFVITGSEAPAILRAQFSLVKAVQINFVEIHYYSPRLHCNHSEPLNG